MLSPKNFKGKGDENLDGSALNYGDTPQKGGFLSVSLEKNPKPDLVQKAWPRTPGSQHDRGAAVCCEHPEGAISAPDARADKSNEICFGTFWRPKQSSPSGAAVLQNRIPPASHYFFMHCSFGTAVSLRHQPRIYRS